MSTNTNTNTEAKPEIIVTADAAVVKSIASFLTLSDKAEAAQAAAEGGYIGIAKAALPVVARQGYTDKAQVSQMLLLSFLSQAGVLELADDDKKKVDVMDRQKSNISNLVAIIVPKTPELAAARDKVFAYNDALPKDARRNLRIGQKHLLSILRGQSTVDDVIAIKEGREPSKPTPAAGGQSAAAAGVQATATPATAGETTNGVVTSQPDATAPQPGADATPTGQTATPVSTPSDAFRHVLRTMLPNYVNNLGMTKEAVKTVLEEELAKFMAS